MKSPMELKDNSTDKDLGQSIQEQVHDSSNSDRVLFIREQPSGPAEKVQNLYDVHQVLSPFPCMITNTFTQRESLVRLCF